MYFSAFTVEKISDIQKKLKTQLEGLSLDEVKKRQQEYGLNQISGKEIKWFHILGRQFKSPFIYLLFFASALSFFFGEKVDGLMIIAFILINTILGFSQEYHSEKSLKLLNKFIIHRAKVKRNNKDELVDSKELVPGDIVLIETGDVVPADMRLIETNDLSIDESILSGESVPVNKGSTELAHPALEIYQAQNITFSGTHVVSGKGVGVVLATANNTVIGEVAKLTAETRRESIFEKGIAKFSRFILRMILVILVVLFVVNLIIKGPDKSHLIEFTLFSIALAVSVIPEALPVVTTLSLSRGALRLAKNKVVVKRLSAVEDLGSIEILCTDKTGTITENVLNVANVNASNQKQCLYYAAMASSFLTETGKDKEPNNSFDLALWKRIPDEEKESIKKMKRISEIPFDPNRRRNSVLIKEEKKQMLIVRGAPEAVISHCLHISSAKKQEYENWLANEGREGRRTIAVAIKENNKIKHDYKEKDEDNLKLLGLISFLDPIKKTTHDAVQHAKKLGIQVKIITGDSREVAGAVAHEINLIENPRDVMTGGELDKLNDNEQEQAVRKHAVFARVSPQQKYRIIELLKRKNEVGFLGEGINDAPALKLANVALVVEGAADIAREASDIVLLQRSLEVIIKGIKDGRQVFANTVKYLKITLISNFGNFYAIAIASLIIPFLPMLPVQILLLNLLSDFPMIAIALDRVDPAELKRPRTYNIKEVVLIAIILGLVSTVFDSIFFMLFFKHEPSVLQTNWFIGSVLTELFLIFSVRTHFFFLRAKAPSKVLSLLFVLIVGVTVLLPFTGLGTSLFRFTAPSAQHLLIIFGVVVSYFAVTEIIKLFYYRFTSSYYTASLVGVVLLMSLILPKISQASFYRDPFVKIYKADSKGEFKEVDNFFAYDPAFKGGVSLALGDLGGDGVNEVITGPGIGSAPIVRVFRLDGSLIREFSAYASNMDKGVNVSTGDLDGDGKDEIITAPRTGGGPHVRVFDGYGKPKFNYGFFAYDYRFQNGVNIAGCDVNGDNRDEIITGPGNESDPVVKVFNYRGRNIMLDYYPFSPANRGGVTVGCANVDGGPEEEIIMAIQSNGENWVKVYKGNKEKSILGYFKAWPNGVRTGINVAGGDIDGDNEDEVVASVYGSGGPQVRMFEAFGQEVNPGFFAFEEDFMGGVNIAVGQADKYSRDEVVVAPSKPKPTGRTDLERYVLVDLSEQRLYAYHEGYLENTFLVSTGKTGPTPVGSFYVRRKIYNHLYVGPGYYLPNTLYNMEFYPSYYLHGAYWHNNFGHPMSHGCVNISYTNAAWLWNWTSVGTPVFVQY